MSDMCQSLNIKDNIDAIFESGERSGNSGSFFFFSKDKKFVVKTMRFNEKAILLSMLDKMYQHFLETQNKSIIAKIYGLYSIKSNFFRNFSKYFRKVIKKYITLEITYRVISIDCYKYF